MNKRLFLAPLMALVSLLLPAATSAFAGYMVTGKFLYQDREFSINGFTGKLVPRPIRFGDVKIMAGTIELARGATKEDGTFLISVPSSFTQSITAVCVTSTSQTAHILLDVRVANDDFSFGDYYSVSSDPVNVSGTDVVGMGTTIALSDNDAGKAFNLFDVAVDSEQFVASNASGSFPARKLTVLWRLTHPRSGSFYQPVSANRYLFVEGISAYDDTIISHEFGHYIDDLYSKSDSPGGQHFIGDGSQDIRLSWTEGLATFLGCSIRYFKGYPRPEIYVKTDGRNGLSFSFEIETVTSSTALGSKTGSTNELAVGAALWDIIDGPATPDAIPGADDDPMQLPFGYVWKVLTQYMPTVTQPGISVETFWDGWFSPLVNNGDRPRMQTVFSTVNGIEFVADAEESDNSRAEAPQLTLLPRPALAGGSRVVINELDPGSIDAVELYNAGDSEADLTGWSVQAVAPGFPSATFVIPPFKLASGAFVILTEASGMNTNSVLYFGINISWANGKDGACALRDSGGRGVDFVRWGGSNEPVPRGTSFAGNNPDSPPIGKNLARSFAGRETDSGSDWTAQNGTLGTFNPNGQERHHTYYPAGDVDFAGFNAIAGRHYLIETLTLLNCADTIIDIVDRNGSTVLASNDDFGVTKASRLSWTAPADGKYFVRSRRFDGASNDARYGSYDLRVIESISPFTIALPAVLTVSQPGQGGVFQSLADAILAAFSGDEIQIVDSGTYNESPTIYGKTIAIKAASGKSPILDGRGGFAPSTISINAKSFRIEGLTVLAASRGIRVDSGNVTIANSVIAGASDAAGFSDGIQITGSDSNVTIINSTILNNGRLGVGVFGSSKARIVNCIFQGNGSADVDTDGTVASLVVNNSLVESAEYAGRNGNVKGDPQFLDAANGNFRLRSTSPAIDAGDATDPDLPATDADGIPRSLDGSGTGKAIPDMGAYEYLPSGLLTSSAVFPQIATGGTGPTYRTSIAGINIGPVPAVVNLSLTKSNSDPFPITVLNAGGTGLNPSAPAAQAAFTRGTSSTFDLSIPPSGLVRVDATDPGDITSGYARLLSSVPIDGTVLIKTVRDDTVLSEAGAGVSKPARKFTVYVDNVANAFSGYAVANFGTVQADLTLTLRSKAGQQLEQKTISLPPGRQIAKFAAEPDQFATTAGAGFEGTIEFSSNQEVAAEALRFDNLAQDVFSMIPVLVDEGSKALFFPQVADGGGYRTNFILVNPSGSPVTAHFEFYASDGTPLSLPAGGLPKTSYDLPLNPKGAVRLFTDGTSPVTKVGWVKVTSPVPIGGSAIFQTLSGTRINSEAGVAASPPAEHFTTYVTSLGFAASGLAICNPNAGKAGITLRLHDAMGLVVDTTSFEMGPSEHVARFFTEWFAGGHPEFEGTLEVFATVPVSAVALRYDNEQQNVFAALPVIVIP